MINPIKEILEISPYKPGKPIEETQREYGLQKVYKLASNENLLGTSQRVKEAILKAVDQIHRYPDGSCYLLKKALSKYYSVAEDKIALGNGSDELIVLLMRSFCRPGDKVLLSKGSFLLYSIFAQGCLLKKTEVPLKKDYSIDLKGLMTAWRPEHKIVFLPNPNNPTGSCVSDQDLREFVHFFHQKQDVLIVVDEAYSVFVTRSDYPQSIKMLKEFPRLVVLRTLSKDHGLAGLRLGFLLADPCIVDVINRIRTPFNVNYLAQVAAVAALEDQEYLDRSRTLNAEGLQYFEKCLSKMKLPFCQSQGNFIFFDSLRDSTVLFQELLKKGLILRPLKPYGFETQLRMTVGLMEDNKVAMHILESVIKDVSLLR